jgi:uncharacterized hydrophobic protein (TIGR00271 family)
VSTPTAAHGGEPLLAIGEADLVRMRDQLFFDGPAARRKFSKFWTLLLLAAIIASAGIVADSTATVIGAMIVAPLMTPILGMVLAITTRDGPNLLRSFVLVTSGALVVIAIAYLIGVSVPYDITGATSSQVAGRINPRLIDLIAALATGAVGSFAMVRSDVSDTLPGVAIAISLVPPLAVVGITLEAGAGDEAEGALLLFMTNVGAILLTGIIVMSLYRVGRTAGRAMTPNAKSHRLQLAIVIGFVIAIAVPLAASSRRIARDSTNVYDVNKVAASWAESAGWRIEATEPVAGAIVVRAAGGLPVPSGIALRSNLDAAGLRDLDVRLILTPEETIELEGR